MTACQPRHGRHGWVNRARARLAAFLDWACGPYEEEWDGRDDNGEPISDLVGDVELAGPDDWPEPDDGRDVADAIHDAEAAEDVPGSVTPSAGGPGYFHDDAPTVVVPAVQLSDGSYTGLKGTVALDDTFIEARPEPRAGRSLWAPPRPVHPAWVQRILDAPLADVLAAFTAPDPDMYLWNVSQRRALAAA